MKKKIIAIAAALMMASAPAMAQVFIMDDDEFNNQRVGSSSMDVDLPGTYNSGEDWYTPLDGGTLLLVGLVGVYLIEKRKNKHSFV
ncbi:MAG: hypothetical protein IJ622_11765 [Bacteroidales bacterium]|nr:hypothetical protein [Bacteroidales bacterium]